MWYTHPLLSALTTGYIISNFSTQNLSHHITTLCAKLCVILVFFCAEMSNSKQSSSTHYAPETLVHQVLMASKNADAQLSAENALPRYNATSYNRIINNSCTRAGSVAIFNYLHLTDELIKGSNSYALFKNLISSLKSC